MLTSLPFEFADALFCFAEFTMYFLERYDLGDAQLFAHFYQLAALELVLKVLDLLGKSLIRGQPLPWGENAQTEIQRNVHHMPVG